MKFGESIRIWQNNSGFSAPATAELARVSRLYATKLGQWWRVSSDVLGCGRVSSDAHNEDVMARRNEIQTAYANAKAAFDAAERGYRAELAQSGLEAAIDSANDETEIDAISVQIDALAAKWQMEPLRRAMQHAETRLLDWSLSVAIRVRPSAADDVALLRERMHLVMSELIAAAMRLPG